MIWLFACTAPVEDTAPVVPVEEDPELLSQPTVDLGLPCGGRMWEGLPTEGIFVDDLGSDEGDGTREHPVATIARAMELGDRVLLAPGTYVGPEALWETPRQLEVLGQCRDEVILVGETLPPITMAADAESDLLVQSVTVTGGWGAVWAFGGHLRLTDLRIEGNESDGVFASGAEAAVVLKDVLIEGLHPASSGPYSYGIFLGDGARLEGYGVEVRDVEGYAVAVDGLGSEGVFDALHVSDIQAFHERASGLSSRHEGRLLCTACRIEDVAISGVYASDRGWLRMEGSTVAGVQEPGGVNGGVVAIAQGQIELQDTRISDIDGYGVVALDQGAVVLDQVEIVRARFDSPSTPGAGIAATSRGLIEGSRVTVRDTKGAALLATDHGRIELRAVTVLGVDAGVGGSAGLVGPGVLADALAIIGLHGVRIERATGHGLQAQQGGVISAEDLILRDTRPVVDADYGLELVAYLDGVVRVLNGAIHSPLTHGGAASLGGRLELTNVVFHPSAGVGVVAQSGGSAWLDQVSFLGRTAGALTALGEGTLVEGRGLLMRDTLRRDDIKVGFGASSGHGASMVLEDVLIGSPWSLGLVAEGGALQCTDCRIDQAILAGVFVADGGTATLVDTTVSGVLPEPTQGVGVGVFVGAAEGRPLPSLVATGLTVDATGIAGVWADGADLSLTDCSLSPEHRVEVLPGVWTHGDGLYATRSTLALSGCHLHDAPGVGLFLNGVSGDEEELSYADNSEDRVEATDRPTLVLDFWNQVDLSGLN